VGLILGVLVIAIVGGDCLIVTEKAQDWRRPLSGLAFPVPSSQKPIVNRNRLSPRRRTRLFATKDEESGSDAEESVSPATVGSKVDKATLRIWPCFDKLDKELIRISLPVIGNYAINPLIGAVDLFWVNRMGNALAVAGQAAANQVFSSAFWFTSFLPSGKMHTR